MANPSNDQGGGQVQGEGDYASARRYQKDQHEFAKSGKVDKAARDAEAALDGPEGAELEQARKQTAKGKGDSA
jgi:hypothetical protein